MGSEKYPDENAFSNFISAKGGESNAYTMSEYTNYHFKVNYENIEKALDLQANLLAKPLLKKSGQEREIKAVNQEFESNFTCDSVRRELIMAEIVPDRSHPLACF
jgi:insulysin